MASLINLSLSSKVTSNYNNSISKSIRDADYKEEDFNDFLKHFHSVFYDDTIMKFRGMELYDIRKIDTSSVIKYISVRVRPSLKTGARKVSRIPSVKDSILRSKFGSIINIDGIIPKPRINKTGMVVDQERARAVVTWSGFTKYGPRVAISWQNPDHVKIDDTISSWCGYFDAKSGRLVNLLTTEFRNDLRIIGVTNDGRYAYTITGGFAGAPHFFGVPVFSSYGLGIGRYLCKYDLFADSTSPPLAKKMDRFRNIYLADDVLFTISGGSNTGNDVINNLNCVLYDSKSFEVRKTYDIITDGKRSQAWRSGIDRDDVSALHNGFIYTMKSRTNLADTTQQQLDLNGFTQFKNSIEIPEKGHWKMYCGMPSNGESKQGLMFIGIDSHEYDHDLGSNILLVFDITTFKVIDVIKLPFSASSASFSEDLDVIAFGGNAGMVHVYSRSKKKVIFESPTFGRSITLEAELHISKDGTQLLVVDSGKMNTVNRTVQTLYCRIPKP